MAANGSVTISVRCGPMFRAACELLASAGELAKLIPDAHAGERRAFIEQCQRFAAALQRNAVADAGQRGHGSDR